MVNPPGLVVHPHTSSWVGFLPGAGKPYTRHALVKDGRCDDDLDGTFRLVDTVDGVSIRRENHLGWC